MLPSYVFTLLARISGLLFFVFFVVQILSFMPAFYFRLTIDSSIEPKTLRCFV